MLSESTCSCIFKLLILLVSDLGLSLALPYLAAAIFSLFQRLARGGPGPYHRDVQSDWNKRSGLGCLG